MKKLAVSICLLSLSLPAYSGGYRVAIQGQKALGMAHTGVAMGESAETVFFNPAAMTELEGTFNVVGAVNFVDSESRFQNTETNSSAKTNNGLANPLNLYGTWRHNEKWVSGLGIYTPYGSAVEWDKDWVGSHLINDISLRAVFIQPTLAYQINDQFSVGVGPILAIGAVDLNRNLSTSLQNEDGERSNVTIKENGIVEFGYSLGLFYNPNENWNMGFNYRSEITMKSKGKADFENIPAPLQAVFVDGGYTANLPLPAELTLGVAYTVTDDLTIAFDYNYTFWDAYENLTFNFDSIADPSRAVSVNPRNYKNSSNYRLGVQYAYSEPLTLRAGIYRDETPVRDGYFAPETPRADATGFTAGLSYKMSDNLELDSSLLFLYFSEEDNSYDFNPEGRFAGTYKVSALSFGFGLTYKL